MKTAHLLNGIVRIRFPENKAIKAELESVQRIIYVNNAYETIVTTRIVYVLRKHKFIFSSSLKKWEQKYSKHENVPGKNQTLPDHLKLYPFQEKGVAFINKDSTLKPYGCALIADEMGLGKTVQALAWLKQSCIRPVLIICPASLKYQWRNETLKWLGEHAEIINGRETYKLHEKIVIINYDILHDWANILKDYGFEVIVLDEAHLIKRNQAKRTKAFKKINKSVKHLIALTGTPIENKPIEIYNIVNAISPYLFPNYMEFAETYCGAKKTRFGWDMSGSQNALELNHILKNSVMIRRKKKDVLKELPEKQIVKIPIDISNKEEYAKAETAFVNFLLEKFSKHSDEELKKELKDYAKRKKIEISDDPTSWELNMVIESKIAGFKAAPILTKMESLKQLAVKGKMNEITDWIKTFLESGEKLVVFAFHKTVINELMKHFPKAVKIDGSVSPSQRQKIVEQFQNDPNTKLFIGNIEAAGVGITLTAASNAAILEFPWKPSTLNQAMDRIHRITQTKQVTIWQLVAVDTIEEKIIDLLKKKENIVANVLDGKMYVDESIFMDLIESYRKIKK
jgi:SWI/SNF-related matrix-associated actin-dependent regulator 1 of chromatin subfamily A